MLAQHSAFLSAKLGLDTANHAATTAASAATNSALVIQQAGVAAAGGFASVMADVPFPANVALAPEVAAAAMAAVLGNLSLTSAAGGWDVPGSISSSGALAMIHPNEMVLPSDIANTLRGGASFGGPSGGASLSPAGAPQIRISYGNINALDAAGVDAVLMKNSASVVKIIRRELRRSNGF